MYLTLQVCERSQMDEQLPLSESCRSVGRNSAMTLIAPENRLCNQGHRHHRFERPFWAPQQKGIYHDTERRNN